MKSGIMSRDNQLANEQSNTNSRVSNEVKNCLRRNLLTILNVVGVVTGVVVALILRHFRPEKWTQREIIYVGFVGESACLTAQSTRKEY
jgi:hypothetical protein